MTYQTVIDDLLFRFPELRELADDCTCEEDGQIKPLPYVAFGCVLLPFLERALSEGNLAAILKLCAYLEDAAADSRRDPMIENLIAVEIGEWLEWTPYEKLIGPWLGTETKRICRYVPGLAMQRNESRQQKRKPLFTRLGAFLRKKS